MARLIKNSVLLGAFIVAWALALAQLSRRGELGSEGSSAEKRRLERIQRNRKRWALRIVAYLTVAALGGFLFAASGIMSIKASSGHWVITAWLLNFTMRRSVVTHSLGTETPRLDDPALVLKGAGHYEIGCRPCHGSPDMLLQPRIALSMTPHPPNLSREVPKWEAKELFYIVKHGVKFTGMPAWPAQKRDDEVWAIVAFLLTLPTLTADEYKRLVQDESSGASGGAPIHDLLGAQKAPPAVTESCGRCHGTGGNGRGRGAFPKLAGQKPAYLAASLHAYARGRRSSGIMEPIAAGLSPEATTELARYYAGLESSLQKQEIMISEPNLKPENQNPKSMSAIERGREIALRGIPRQRVPACSECHGPSDHPRNPHYPILAGQYADYLVLQLTLFKRQARGGTAYAHLMRPVAAGLTPEQMRDVALFYESLQSH